MIRALWTSASGMQAQQLIIDAIANNLANVNTTGFKRSRADFQDLLYQTLRVPGGPSSSGTEVPTGMELGHGSHAVAIQKLFLQGDYQQTQNDLDLAIEGSGFFQVKQPNGEVAYTRAGALKLNNEGRLVTSDGLPIEPEITIPPEATKVSIVADGTVSVLVPGKSQPVEVGNLKLARFVNPGGLSSIGKNLYLQTAASGDASEGKPGEEGLGTLSQGSLEMSNVNVVEEMVNMIAGQRAYEINSKAVQAADEMLQIANNIRR
jgi:flagellar basal-body rod protein FlgG